MNRFACSLVLLLVSSIASAQDFTTQDPRYTTTPSQYTTTPAAYTTTPSRYTTTPPEYVPQADTVPTTPTIPTIPTNVPGTGNNPLPTNPVTSTSSTRVTATQTLQSQSVEVVAVEEETESVEVLESEETSETDPLIELFAGCVLQLDEEETQQFAADYDEVVAQVGPESSEVSWSTRFKIVLYLTLRRMLGLSGRLVDAGDFE
ncbi:hypothetical protein Pan97_17070 [Bremerella volcania]|uniref:Uncharacterized protein n=1 Tax=Bremerella volcania TaxID=2527984 RepID=A0A518C659_9BACT|nr:hypothetical protein [Bremerella volcania]QDU74694.1 hypothetical protein Pan97_17070 [Bremerella volcania]